ncbi:MAG: hypothetical protein JWM11_1693 [Planctomycetaceae bacterium]|nr:hypothetical protein [Planctomycetaceae bacterium]
MNFVGIGANSLWFMASLVGGVMLYVLYLWSLWRILTKIHLPLQFLAYAVFLDVFLSVLGFDVGRWFWIWPLRPPIPVSAFCAIVLLAFANCSAGTTKEVPNAN